MSDFTVDDRPPSATFVCGWTEPVTALGVVVGCGHEFTDRVPPIYLELPSCPECGSPSALLDVLRSG